MNHTLQDPAAWAWADHPSAIRVLHPCLPSAGDEVEDETRRAWTQSHGHAHSYREILMCLRGATDYGMAGKVYRCEPGSVFFFDIHCAHDQGYPQGNADADHLWILFAPDRINVSLYSLRNGQASREDGFRLLLCEPDLGMDLSHVWPAREVAAELASATLRARLLSASLLLSAVIRERATQPGSAQQERSFQEEIITAVRAHLEQTAGHGDTVDSLARLAGYSKYHFLRLFKHHTGHTIHQFIDICRYARVQTLTDRGFNKTQIATELGFSSPSSFLRWWKKYRK